MDTFDAFPFVGWLRTRLSAVDASGTPRTFAPNASRWLAHRTERTAAAPGAYFARVSARVAHRFLFESASPLVTLTLRNEGAAPVRLGSLSLLVWAGVRTTPQMAWVVPTPSDDGSWACGVLPASDAAQTPVLRFLDAISPARLVAAVAPAPAAFSTFGYEFGRPGLATCGGNASFGDVTLAAGAEFVLTLGAVPGLDAGSATAPLLQLLAAPGAAAAASDAAWQARWAAAFAPGNLHFSGNAPLLTEGAPSAVGAFYYASLLTIVSLQRTSWAQSPIFADCPRLYPIGYGGPAGGGAPGGRPLGGSAYWIWDESYATLTLALLDPAALRAYLRVVLAELDWSSTNALDLLTAAPIPPWPNGFGGGGGYYFNALQLFTAVTNYVAATNDTQFLEERLGPQPQVRVVDRLVSFALHWQQFDADGDFLAEYSADDGNYLECVPHYRGTVAALQGGSVFMMRSAADLKARCTRAASRRCPPPPPCARSRQTCPRPRWPACTSPARATGRPTPPGASPPCPLSWILRTWGGSSAGTSPPPRSASPTSFSSASCCSPRGRGGCARWRRPTARAPSARTTAPRARTPRGRRCPSRPSPLTTAAGRARCPSLPASRPRCGWARWAKRARCK